MHFFDRLQFCLCRLHCSVTFNTSKILLTVSQDIEIKFLNNTYNRYYEEFINFQVIQNAKTGTYCSITMIFLIVISTLFAEGYYQNKYCLIKLSIKREGYFNKKRTVMIKGGEVF